MRGAPKTSGKQLSPLTGFGLLIIGGYNPIISVKLLIIGGFLVVEI